MVNELSPNSRFTVSENPNARPGKCALCGSSGGDARQFVDFGMQLDVYGAVYFCTHCITELAEAIGFVERSKLEEIKTALDEQQDFQKRAIGGLEEKLNAARVLLRDCNCESSFGGELLDLADVETASGSGSDSGEVLGSDFDADESSDSEGFADVPGIASDDQPEPPKRSRKRTNSSDE